MPLQSSGEIGIEDLKREFNANSNKLSDYYRGGSIVANSTANNSIPTSDEILLSHFYGASRSTSEPTPLSVSPPQINLSGNGQTKSVTISTSKDWTITSPIWLTVSPSSGTGTETVNITSTLNDTSSERNAIITVNTDNEQATFDVRQYENQDTLSINPRSKVISDGGFESYLVSFTSNSSITATPTQSWVSTNIFDNNIRIQVSQNNSEATRFAAVEIETANGRREKHNIKQEVYNAVEFYRHNVERYINDSNICTSQGANTTVYSNSSAFSLSNRLYNNSTLTSPVNQGFYKKDNFYLETDNNGEVIDENICRSGGGFS